MEHNENTDQVLNSYFAKAGEEQPVVAIDEVKELITSTPASSVDYHMSQQVLSKFKYWLGGGLLVTAGIVAVYLSSADKKEVIAENIVEPKTETVQETTAPQAVNTIENKEENTAVVKDDVPVSKKEAIRNPINTATETSAPVKKTFYYPGAAIVNFEMNGKSVSMSIDSEVRSLQVDGVTIDKKDYASYPEIIEKGKAMKFESDKENMQDGTSEDAEQAKNKSVMAALIDQLEEDNLIDESGHFEFRLTSSTLYINNTEQNDAVFQQYKNLYESTSGNKLNKKSNIRIKH